MSVAGYKRIANKKVCVFVVTAVDLLGHHRLTRIPPRLRAEALGVWTAGLLWTRANERDGFVSIEALNGIARDKIIDELVRVGLVTRHVDDCGDHGFILHRYDLYNELKAEIDSRRLKWRTAKVAPSPPSVSPDSAENPPSVRRASRDHRTAPHRTAEEGSRDLEVSPAREDPEPTPFGRPDYRSFPIARWCEGVHQVTGKDVLPPIGGSLNRLVAAFEKYGPKDQRELDDWAYRVGMAYAEKQAGREVVGSWCADWLGSGDCPVDAPLAKAPLPPPPSREQIQDSAAAAKAVTARVAELFAPKVRSQ
jgi:hypothetical protein